HWHMEVRNYLNQNLPRRWIGRSTGQNMALTRWPPAIPDLTSLKQRITTAVASVGEGMLRSVWNELDYRIDICRGTKGSHIEHC
ncbi:hypothetical protein B7P43_G11662, partial [Cryptotermes secundus]